MTLFTRLFTLTEADASQLSQEKAPGGLVSPYSVTKADTTAIAIDELSADSQTIGFIISNTHRKCSPSIDLIKRIDPNGFMEFKSRIVDTLNLNNILTEDSSLQEQLAEVFAWGYADCSKKDKFLVFSDKKTAEKVAIAIYNRCKEAGLKVPPGKVSRLLLDVLIAVLQKLETGKSHGNSKPK